MFKKLVAPLLVLCLVFASCNGFPEYNLEGTIVLEDSTQFDFYGDGSLVITRENSDGTYSYEKGIWSGDLKNFIYSDARTKITCIADSGEKINVTIYHPYAESDIYKLYNQYYSEAVVEFSGSGERKDGVYLHVNAGHPIKESDTTAYGKN